MARCRIALAVAVVALVLGAWPARAGRQVFVETRGGVNLAKLTGDVPTSNKTGFSVGVAMHVPLQSHLSLQGEIDYVAKGGSFGMADNPVYAGTVYTGRYNQLYALDYIEFPVLARMTVGTSALRPSVIAGPYLGWKVLEKVHLNSSDEKYMSKGDAFAPLEVGATLGGGIEFGPPERCVSVEARYTRGLTNSLRGMYRQSLQTNEVRLTLGWRSAYPSLVDLH